jgi:hypothetical protein
MCGLIFYTGNLFQTQQRGKGLGGGERKEKIGFHRRIDNFKMLHFMLHQYHFIITGSFKLSM